MIDKLAWIQLKDHKILCVRSKGKQLFYIPGGKREKGESNVAALSREIKEELEVTLNASSIKFVKSFEAQADGREPGIFVRMTCYMASYTGTLKAAAEIEELAWLGYSDKPKVSKVGHLIFDHLKKVGKLD
ncbi:MAG: NUDIX domain-containing protein [Maribacter sp.]|nr:NUDIX domain-containing protein [Maribacter sp.]